MQRHPEKKKTLDRVWFMWGLGNHWRKALRARRDHKKKINYIFGKKIGFPIGHVQPSV